MIAADLVKVLIESDDDFDPKGYIMKQPTKELQWYGHKFQERIPPGFQRRQGRGYDKQWWMIYNGWKIVLGTYEDGKTLWHAEYTSPEYEWSHKWSKRNPERPPEGRSWSGGADIVELPPGADLNKYLQRVKKMIDQYPSDRIWRERHVPPMPQWNKEHDRYGITY